MALSLEQSTWRCRRGGEDRARRSAPARRPGAGISSFRTARSRPRSPTPPGRRQPTTRPPARRAVRARSREVPPRLDLPPWRAGVVFGALALLFAARGRSLWLQAVDEVPQGAGAHLLRELEVPAHRGASRRHGRRRHLHAGQELWPFRRSSRPPAQLATSRSAQTTPAALSARSTARRLRLLASAFRPRSRSARSPCASRAQRRNEYALLPGRGHGHSWLHRRPRRVRKASSSRSRRGWRSAGSARHHRRRGDVWRTAAVVPQADATSRSRSTRAAVLAFRESRPPWSRQGKAAPRRARRRDRRGAGARNCPRTTRTGATR